MGRPDIAVRITAVFTSAAYGIALYWVGIRIDADIRRALAYLPILAVLGLVAWDLQVWHWPLLHRLTGRPRLDGLWRVTLLPTKESHIPPGGNRGPIVAYLAISQTFWRFNATLITKESYSVTRTHYWMGELGDALEWVSFIYDNSPQRQYQNRSTRHLGTCTLRPGARKPSLMSGAYFTDRYTQGDIELELIGRDSAVASFTESEAKVLELQQKAATADARKAALLKVVTLGLHR